MPALLFALTANSSIAADLDLSSRIERVTVYPDGALVTRAGRVELPAGSSRIMLRGLPTSIDSASIRIEGQGTSGFAIGAIDIKQVPSGLPVTDAALEARLTTLRDEREAILGRMGAATGKRAAIERFAQAGPDKLGGDGRAMAVSEWEAAWETIGSGLAKVNEELRLATVRKREIEAEIAALERAKVPGPSPTAPKRDVLIAVEATAATNADLAVSYRVSGAGWLPSYEAKLVTGAKATIALVRRAEVRQTTGEDWNDVVLRVSTVRTARGTAAPDLPPIQIAFFDPELLAAKEQELRQRAARERTSAKSLAAPAPVADSAAAPPRALAEEPVPAEIVAATLEASAFQANFAVPGRVSLDSDGSIKALTLSQKNSDPILLAKATPELDATAYLEAAFINEDEAPVLPGIVALHRDGAYIGRGRLGFVAPGDKIELGFGADDRIIVKRVPVKRRENEPSWLGQTRTDTREFRTTVRNLHAVPVKVTVFDRLPFSENTAITVEQLPATTPPTEKQSGDKRGVLRWSFEAAPGTEKEIRLAYRLKWPSDREVRYEQQPLR